MENVDVELCDKFPCVLKDKLLNGEIRFPIGTRFKYEKILAYRAVKREEDDYSEVTREDFRSYFELKKSPKIRGLSSNLQQNPLYYGVSTSLDRRLLEQLMHFPTPKKKIAKGYVHSDGGPECTNDKHVCWWLFEDADLSSFHLD